MLSLSLYSSSNSVSLLLARNTEILKFLEYNDECDIKTDKIFELLETASKLQDLNKIDQIFLSRGPGSFTSIRSIISLAQGLSLSSKAKIISVTMFDIILSSVISIKTPAIVFFKESRLDFYFQFFIFRNQKWESESKILSGSALDIEKNIKIYMKKKNLKNITLLSNKFEHDLSKIKHLEYLVLKTDAKSIFFSVKKNYGSKTLKPIYYHPHYAERN